MDVYIQRVCLPPDTMLLAFVAYYGCVRIAATCGLGLLSCSDIWQGESGSFLV